MSEPTARRAAAKGLILLLIANVLLSMGYLLWIWNSVHPAPVERTPIVVPGKVIEQSIEEESQPDSRVEEIIQTIEKLRNCSLNLTLRLSASEEQQALVVSKVIQRVQLLQYNSNLVGSKRPEKREIEFEKPDLIALEALFSQQSITETPSDTLQELFHRALTSLAAVKSSNVDWAQLDEILNTQRKRSYTVARDPPVCPATAEIKLKPDVARQYHVHAKVNTMRSLLGVRQDPNQLIHTLKKSTKITRMIQEMLPILQDVPSSHHYLAEHQRSPDDDVCVDKESVGTMVQGALKDSSQMNDLLASMVKDLDPNEKNLIFDAILGLSGEAVVPPKETINLRQLLDGGLTKWLSRQFDGLMDLLSGYNDFFDGSIDQLLEKNPDLTVGKILLGQVMDFAGRVSVPKYFQTKAGVLID